MNESDLSRHRVLIDACLRLGVPFFWQGPGTLLISRRGAPAVIADVLDSGHRVLGYEGFELNGVEIHPRLDLIYDAKRRPDILNPVDLVAQWPEDVWVDVVLGMN